MTKQQIVQQTAESTGISRLQARHTVDAFIKTMASAFAKKGDSLLTWLRHI